MLFMLEDDLDRIERFGRMASLMSLELRVFRTAPRFIEEYSIVAAVTALICLDHDLFADNPEDPDPGDGRDVSRFLVLHRPIAPVLIHSTNTNAADSMFFSLQEFGWNVDRIAPIGEDWIEAYEEAFGTHYGPASGNLNVKSKGTRWDFDDDAKAIPAAL